MNKIAFISDIHGNYEALKVVLKEIDKLNINKIFCLGDVTGYYSQVNECCDLLRAREIPCLMGNHDWYLASGSFCPRSQSVNDCLKYQRQILSSVNLEWVKSFPIFLEYENMKMVHGGWINPIDEYLLKPNEEYFEKLEGEIFLSGHTHLPRIDYFGKKTYCNPGSVGQPRDNNPKASFATYYKNKFEIHRVDYEKTKVYELMDNAGFNDYYYGCLETGARNLCKLGK